MDKLAFKQPLLFALFLTAVLTLCSTAFAADTDLNLATAPFLDGDGAPGVVLHGNGDGAILPSVTRPGTTKDNQRLEPRFDTPVPVIAVPTPIPAPYSGVMLIFMVILAGLAVRERRGTR